MMKPNSADGFGGSDCPKPEANKNGANSPDAKQPESVNSSKGSNVWPKSSNWHERIQLSLDSQTRLSDQLDAALAQLEINFATFVTTNSTKAQIRQSR